MGKSKFQLNLIVVTFVIILLVLLLYILGYSKREGFKVSCRNNRKQQKKVRYLITRGPDSGNIVLTQPRFVESKLFHVYRNQGSGGGGQLSKKKCQRYRDTLSGLSRYGNIQNKKYNKSIGSGGRGGLESCEPKTWLHLKWSKRVILIVFHVQVQKILSIIVIIKTVLDKAIVMKKKHRALINYKKKGKFI